MSEAGAELGGAEAQLQMLSGAPALESFAKELQVPF